MARYEAARSIQGYILSNNRSYKQGDFPENTSSRSYRRYDLLPVIKLGVSVP